MGNRQNNGTRNTALPTVEEFWKNSVELKNKWMRYLRVRYPGLSDIDIEEIVSDAVIIVAEHLKNNHFVDEKDNPYAYYGGVCINKSRKKSVEKKILATDVDVAKIMMSDGHDNASVMTASEKVAKRAQGKWGCGVLIPRPRSMVMADSERSNMPEKKRTSRHVQSFFELSNDIHDRIICRLQKLPSQFSEILISKYEGMPVHYKDIAGELGFKNSDSLKSSLSRYKKSNINELIDIAKILDDIL